MTTVNIFGEYDESFPSLNGGDFAVVVVKKVYHKAVEGVKVELASQFEEIKAHSFADVKGNKIEVAGYPVEVCDKTEKNYLFHDEGDVQENGGPMDNIAFVTANASKGQDGCPAVMNNKLVGLFSGINTEEDNSEDIIVNLITPEVVNWINTIQI